MKNNGPCPSCFTEPKADTRAICSDDNVLALLKHFRKKKQEYLITLTLDSGYRLIRRRIVTVGLLDTTLIHPREVFIEAITDRAAHLIIAHNHPSGDPTPSREDIAQTQQLAAAGILLGVPLIDHFIVSPTSYYSFKDNCLI